MKDKNLRIVIFVTVIIIILLTYFNSQRKMPVDWTPTFYNTETSPYGTYITYNLLKDIFDGKVNTSRQPIYDNISPILNRYINYYDIDDDDDDEYIPMSFYDSIQNIEDVTAYVFINNSFDIDDFTLNYFLDFIAIGNNVFVSAEDFSDILLDTLKVNTSVKKFHLDSTYVLTDYSKQKYNIRNVEKYTRFHLDSCHHPVRALAKNNNDDTTFIQLRYGKGSIYLHTMPSAFANINMLKTEKYDFGFRSLSYLPSSNNILWDEYQKRGPIAEESLFRVMLNNTPLRLALYIIMGGLLLYMIFGAKRVQRIIPVIKAPVNSSIEFLDTMSNLYFQKKDFKTITHNRHQYFLDFIRKHYYLSTETVDDEFISALQSKSGMTKEKIKRIFTLYQGTKLYLHISNDTFLEYNSLLEEFYKNEKINK